VGLAQVAEPRLEDPGDAIVQVRAAGLCGSDLHVYHGRERGLDLGTVMGHELVGEVVELGRGVEGLRVGDRVASPFSTSCGDCFFCQAGLPARCPRGQLLGWVEGGRGLHGAQAERVRVPLASSTLVRVPEGVSDVAALLAGDVLATGWYGIEQAEGGAGRTVAVVGCGPVGLMACLAAVELGAERVLAVDAVPSRLELAARLGAEPLALAAEPATRVREATGGRGADAVVEAVGSPAALRLAFELARPGATLASVGVHTETALAIAPGELYAKNLTLRSGRCPARRLMPMLFERMPRLAAAVESIVSHHLSLERGPEGYERFARRDPGWTKVLLWPDGSVPAGSAAPG
jgi:threonine dehydrogenase-like Zn-dependent dehydrogenase